jgi:hypothetical protein
MGFRATVALLENGVDKDLIRGQRQDEFNRWDSQLAF